MVNLLKLKRCIKFIKHLHVEPILFLSFLAMTLSQIVQSIGLYKAICQQTFSSNPEIDCDHLSNSSTMVNGKCAEIIVQQHTATWTMAMGIAGTAPALISDLLLGAYGDGHGRKVNILLGLTGNMITIFPFILLFTFPLSVPLYLLVIAHFLSSLTGSVSITMISSMAYLADTSYDKRGLSSRMSAISIFSSAASIIGPFIGAATSQKLSKAQIILIAQIFLVIAFFYCIWRVRHVPPNRMRQILIEKYKKKHHKSEESGEATKQEIELGENGKLPNTTNNQSIISAVFNLLKDTWLAFRKRREGNIRIYLIISALVLFLDVLAHMGLRMTIFPMYAQKAPLSWDQDTLGYYRSMQGIMNMMGTLLGIILFQKILNFTDTFIILIGTLSHICESLILTFATKSWMVYAAGAVSSVGGLSSPCIHAFVAKQVAADDVGKAYTAFGISATIAVLLSNALFNPIYYGTVAYFPGFVFLVAACVQGFAFLALMWLHMDSSFKRQNENWGYMKRLIKSIFESKRETEDKNEHGNQAGITVE